MSAYTDHLADPLRESTWLAEISTRRRSDGAAVTLRYSTGRFKTAATDTPASTHYSARLIEPLNFALEAEDLDATGLPALRGGAMRIGSIAGDLDTLPDDYYLQGSEVVVKQGGYTPSTGHTMTYSEYGDLGTFEIESAEVNDDEITIGLADLSARLDDRIETRYYGGRDWSGRFDNGSSFFSYVDYGTPAKLDITGDLTVEAWVYVESLNAGMRVCGWSAGATAYPFSIQIGSSGRVSYLDNTQTATFSVGTALSTHRWYHLAVTRDTSAGAVNLYLYDWVTRTEQTDTVSSLTLPAPANSGGSFRVGAALRGLLSNVRVLDAVLTQRQIQNNRWEEWGSSHPLYGDLMFQGTLNETTADASASPATPSTTGSATYVPTADGDDQLAGAPVPVVYGKVRNITGQLVDSRRLIWQLADFGEDVSSVAVYEGGYPITAGSARTNLIDLLVTAPTAATYDWHLSGNGAFIRLGSNPSKPVTADVTMTNTALDDVLEDLLTERGTEPFSGVDLDIVLGKSPAVGWYSDGNKATVRNAVDYLCSTLGSYWVARDGAFVFRDLYDPDSGTPVATLTEAQVIDWKEVSRADPIWQYGLLCRRNWTPLEGDALNSLLIGTAAEPFFRNPWNFARVRDRGVLVDWPRAGRVDRESSIDLRTNALTVADGRLALFSVPSRTLSLTVALTGLAVDRFDVVTLDARQRDQNYDEVERLVGDWLVLGLEESASEGTIDMTIWRPE